MIYKMKNLRADKSTQQLDSGLWVNSPETNSFRFSPSLHWQPRALCPG